MKILIDKTRKEYRDECVRFVEVLAANHRKPHAPPYGPKVIKSARKIAYNITIGNGMRIDP
jgi:hypothetical protein